VSQEERSIFWEVIVSVILRNKIYMLCVRIRTVSEIELFHQIFSTYVLKVNKR
jgi:hypothetical protein